MRGGYKSKLEKDVWNAPSRITGIRAIIATTCNKWVHTDQMYSWIRGASQKTHYYCPNVDDFGINYQGQENAKHLHNTLVELYKIITY